MTTTTEKKVYFSALFYVAAVSADLPSTYYLLYLISSKDLSPAPT